MRQRLLSGLVLAITAAVVSPNVNAASIRRTSRPHVHLPPTVLTVPEGTRLLVVAPHPDDEVLGAGGLMQRVHETGGTVRVGYLTNGEGYPEGVEAEEHGGKTPTPDDFRGYGRRRRREARHAVD